MTGSAGRALKLHQCLFGYNDGHRLLASSLRLPSDAASLLLIHSDLLPDFDSSVSDRYWTGLPLPVAKVYALMRTWLAPEMPRPGCVWTHVILVGLADMARLPELSLLTALFDRPSLSGGFAQYERALTIDADEPLEARFDFSHAAALRVLQALYGTEPEHLIVGEPEEMASAVFAVWSQQWPRLRRAFSFRTAATSREVTKQRFDLRISDQVRLRLKTSRGDRRHIEDWERVALDDLYERSPTRFRRFLWRYGADLRRGRERFGFLARLFIVSDRQRVLRGEALLDLLKNINEALPDGLDGKLLKEDLLSGGDNKYSLLPEADPIDLISYWIRAERGRSLPEPPVAAFEAVRNFYPQRAEEIFKIVEHAALENEWYVDVLLDGLITVVEPGNFLGLSEAFPRLRSDLVRLRPELLDTPDIATLTDDELAEFLLCIGTDEELAGKVVRRLLPVNSGTAAGFFVDHFLTLTVDRIFETLGGDDHDAVALAWIAATRREDHNLAGDVLPKVKDTKGLGLLSDWLDLDIRAGLVVPATRWTEALRDATDNISGPKRQKLLAFLLGLGLARPEPSCELLFEFCFHEIHAAIAASILPDDALAMLKRYLPDLGWREQWDVCLRLRTAVVGAYVDHDLDGGSFLRLTDNEDIRGRLINIAADTRKGRRYLDRHSLKYYRGWLL
jgi:GTPase-associated protein 1, N-terminal domain type 1